MATHANISALYNAAAESRHLSFKLPCSLLPQGTAKGRLEKLMTSSPFCHCPLPGSLAILNWLIAEIPALKQCSVRRATAEKIILIWALELIMCTTVSSFHNKFTTLQQLWMEPKSFLLGLPKDNTYPSHLQSNLQLWVVHSKKRLDHFSLSEKLNSQNKGKGNANFQWINGNSRCTGKWSRAVEADKGMNFQNRQLIWAHGCEMGILALLMRIYSLYLLGQTQVTLCPFSSGIHLAPEPLPIERRRNGSRKDILRKA